MSKNVFIIDDDVIMAGCLELAVRKSGIKDLNIRKFSDAISAMNELDNNPPSLILLDIMLSGPDGFTLLNELASYPDTSKIPVVIVTSLNLVYEDLSHYGVIKIFDKATMKPLDIAKIISRELS